MKSRKKIQKWGGSYAVRIPKKMMDKLEIDADNEVEIRVIKSNIVIKKIKNNDNKNSFFDEKTLIESMPIEDQYYKNIAVNNLLRKEYG